MIEPLAIEKVLWMKKGKGVAASGRIPKDAEFFQDHFPGFPVLPGVLALEMLRQTAETYLKENNKISSRKYVFKQIRAVKFSNYLKPGDDWESQLELAGETENEVQWNGKLLHCGQVAVSARFVLRESQVAIKKSF